MLNQDRSPVVAEWVFQSRRLFGLYSFLSFARWSSQLLVKGRFPNGCMLQGWIEEGSMLPI
ncbi:hypothetical protein EDO6_01704 [Paenibacillus xylanexedens]|nr:hypothetical protein EDO6_01704 [Paenibacillus xylanexedens]